MVAQRLVRINCPHCSHDVAVDLGGRPASERARLQGLTLRAGRGCGACRGSGYKGRRAVAEILVLDDELRDLIARRASLARREDRGAPARPAIDAGGGGGAGRTRQTTLAELDR